MAVRIKEPPTDEIHSHRRGLERIIKVMRNPAGEFANAFLPLGTQSFLLHSLGVGGVRIDDQDGHSLAFLDRQKNPATLHLYRSTV